MTHVKVQWEELVNMLHRVEWSEQRLILEFELGLYATREWKRRNAVPRWIIVALTHVAASQGVIVQPFAEAAEETTAKIFLHDDEIEELETHKAAVKRIINIGLTRQREDIAFDPTKREP